MAWFDQVLRQLSCGDPTLLSIDLVNTKLSDKDSAELVDCLLAHPAVLDVCLSDNRLTDETGVKLARYIAASSTVELLGLSYNQLGEATYLAVAAALRVNTSLQALYLYGNQAVDRSRIDAAFIEALWVNPQRPTMSSWSLYSVSSEFERLKHAAEQLGHPSLQLLLLAIVC